MKEHEKKLMRAGLQYILFEEFKKNEDSKEEQLEVLEEVKKTIQEMIIIIKGELHEKHEKIVADKL